MIICFWLCLGAIAFVYVGYPLVLAVSGWLLGRSPNKGDVQPTVSILISAYNEESHIGETIANKLSLDYPADKREVIIVSDASTDRTEQIVREYEQQGVRLIVQKERGGKTAALNIAVQAATGEILVFSDANSMYRRDALTELVRNFADKRVGYVTGRMMYVDETGSLVGSGCSLYMRYENMLRWLETRTSSVIGVDGGVDAVRALLFEPMEPDALPDFVLPLSVIARGYRVVYESEAVLMERALTNVEDEWRMRVRVALRSFHALWLMKRLFNPFRYGWVSFQLTVHKLLRYCVGLLQLVVFVCNMMLVNEDRIYATLFICQVLFYLLAIAGLWKGARAPRMAIIKYPSYLCLLNAAALCASWRFVRGKRITVWNPRKG